LLHIVLSGHAEFFSNIHMLFAGRKNENREKSVL